MTIELRPVETEEDIAAFLDVRARVDPEYPITRANFDDGREQPDRIDVLALLDGEVVGAAWANFLRDSGETSEYLFVSVRVVPERRHRGQGQRSSNASPSTPARSAAPSSTRPRATTTRTPWTTSASEVTSS